MGVPDPERFTIDDVAARWQKSRDHVLDLINTRKLKAQEIMHTRFVREAGKTRPYLEFKFYIERSALYEFEDHHGIHIQVNQATEASLPQSKNKLKKKDTLLGVVTGKPGARPYWGPIFHVLEIARRNGEIPGRLLQTDRRPGSYMSYLAKLNLNEDTKRYWIVIWLLQFHRRADWTDEQHERLHKHFPDAPERNLTAFFNVKLSDYRAQMKPDDPDQAR